jgi:hypothetical protein
MIVASAIAAACVREGAFRTITGVLRSQEELITQRKGEIGDEE